ncbi:unnamed protein product [Withania somnifera]
MDEIWERAVETALDGEKNFGSVKTLTLDGAVKCLHGKLAPPSIFERFENLEHLSIANTGVSSLEEFPRLRNLLKLNLSDNRIAGGLEFLVDAGLNSLRDLDLSNNRIQDIDDLRPLAELRLVSLDLYECPVTRVKDYRSRVFGLIRSLKYLDKMDVEGSERPESDDEEEEDEEDDEDDPGSGEVDGEYRPFRMNNGHRVESEGVVDVDEEESDADEEETEIIRGINGSKGEGSGHSNGFRVEGGSDGEDDEDEDDEDEDFEEEIDEDDVVEVHEIEDSDEDEDGVEDDDDDDDVDDEDDEEEVDNDDADFVEPESTGRLNSTDGEIDGHEHGEDDADEDDDGETGEEEDQGVEEDGDFEDDEDAEDEEEDNGNGYLVQPVGHVEVDDADGSDVEPVNGDEDPDLEEDLADEEDDYGEVQELPPSSSQKRKRDDEDDDGEDDDEECAKSSKHR